MTVFKEKKLLHSSLPLYKAVEMIVPVLIMVVVVVCFKGFISISVLLKCVRVLIRVEGTHTMNKSQCANIAYSFELYLH